MRLALVGPTHPYKGGVAQHTTGLAHRLAAAGCDVRLESWSEQYPARLYPGQQRVTVPELPPYPRTSYPLSWRRPDGWVRLGRRLRREVDAVALVVVTPVQAPAYAALLRSLGRSVHTAGICHNVLPHERRVVDAWLTRRVLGSVGGVLVHSQAEQVRAAALTAAPVAVSPLPPPHRFAVEGAPPDIDRPVLRRLLFFGLVRPYKGLDLLLRALVDSPPDVGLVVAGEFWGGTAQTERLVSDLGLAHRVELRPGYVPAGEVPRLLASVDALVLPYRASTASWNGSLGHEHGLPVVATRVGTLTGQVRNGVDGLLCDPEPESIAAALRRLYEPGELRRLRAGVRPVDSEGQWRDYVTALLGLLGGRR